MILADRQTKIFSPSISMTAAAGKRDCMQGTRSRSRSLVRFRGPWCRASAASDHFRVSHHDKHICMRSRALLPVSPRLSLGHTSNVSDEGLTTDDSPVMDENLILEDTYWTAAAWQLTDIK